MAIRKKHSEHPLRLYGQGMKRFWSSGKDKISTGLADVMERGGTTKKDYLRRNA